MFNDIQKINYCNNYIFDTYPDKQNGPINCGSIYEFN